MKLDVDNEIDDVAIRLRETSIEEFKEQYERDLERLEKINILLKHPTVLEIARDMGLI